MSRSHVPKPTTAPALVKKLQRTIPLPNKRAQRSESASITLPPSNWRAGYVNNSEEGFDAFLPILPRNTEEMRETELYSEEVYKINLVETGASGGGSTGSNIQKDGMFKLHAYDACPDLLRSHSRLGYGSLKDIEDDPVRFRICPECQLSPQSMGSVAAASTSIPNGFEYHYRKVAELARE